MSQQTVLVIDDERDIRELLTITLGRMDLQVDAVGTVAEARRALVGKATTCASPTCACPTATARN
jgi:two-component system response regulator PilR (NtrC family)